MSRIVFLLVLLFGGTCFGQVGAWGVSPYDGQSLENPYGAGSRFRPDGLFNAYSRYGSRFSNESWSNPYATRPPQLWSGGRYYGEFSVNPYRRDSVSNPYGRFGSPYSPQSIRNPYGLGSRYYNKPIYVYPSR